MKRLGVVLSAVAMAAGAAVMGGSAAAAPGIVEWADGQGKWHTIENPDGCYDTPGGKKLNNKTSGPIVLYTDARCKGSVVYTVGVGKSVPPPDVNFESIRA
ncbi:hypothetical protein [Actinopolyspora mortivallis]|uniref:Secreted protein n=1 Tax=Actinopolyspora mortivallis TaxID=33906 RepID=A0A2T0GVW6_ACTMO|nr:hypothetical protein [Actinopolyspora mortivallis]PRW63248.1 hypothetical protein CEP50_11230 [Actinopolyspora mortivallis]